MRERGQPPVELPDAGLQVALALLGRLVFGVLAQVAVLARLLDLLGEHDLQLVVERPDLLFEPLLDRRPLRSKRYYHRMVPGTPSHARPPRSSAAARNPVFSACTRSSGDSPRRRPVLLEGGKLVEEALFAAASTIVEARGAPTSADGARTRRCSARLAQRGRAVPGLDADVLAALSELETSQGVLALARRPVFDEDALFRGHAADRGRGGHPEPRQPGRACCARPRRRARPAPT